MTKKPIKRIDPNKPLVPLNDFKSETRPLTPIDPKLLEMMKQFQKRGVDLVDQITSSQVAEEEREQRELEQQQESDLNKEILKKRSELPKDIAQQIVSGKTKLNDTNLDTNPICPVITRMQVLNKQKNK